MDYLKIIIIIEIWNKSKHLRIFQIKINILIFDRYEIKTFRSLLRREVVKAFIKLNFGARIIEIIIKWNHIIKFTIKYRLRIIIYIKWTEKFIVIIFKKVKKKNKTYTT